jgi:hypothetical protein
MKKTILTAVCLVFMLPLAYAKDSCFLGARICKWCHRGLKKGAIYEKWQKSPHARAFETLKAVGQEKNPQCLECHTTGFNAGAYKVDDPHASEFEGVQCESCHGPGSGYKTMKIMKDKEISLAHGLIEPTEDVCRKCHNEKGPTFKGFDYKKFTAAIDHVYRKK